MAKKSPILLGEVGYKITISGEGTIAISGENNGMMSV